jgi:hypothetical protein
VLRARMSVHAVDACVGTPQRLGGTGGRGKRAQACNAKHAERA